MIAKTKLELSQEGFPVQIKYNGNIYLLSPSYRGGLILTILERSKEKTPVDTHSKKP